MTIQLQVPKRERPLYLQVNHRLLLQNLEKQGIAKEDRRAYAEKLGFGFGYTYMEAAREACSLADQHLRDRTAGAVRDGYWAGTASEINAAEKMIRQHIDLAMQQYLIEKNGCIDIWPVPYYTDGFSAPLMSQRTTKNEYMTKKHYSVDKNVKITFEYFGGDYYTEITEREAHDVGFGQKTERTSILKRREDGYRNEYCAPKTGKFKAQSETVEKLEEAYKIAQIEQEGSEESWWKRIVRPIIWIPALITLVIGVLCLWWNFTGTANMDEALVKGAALQWLDTKARGEGVWFYIAIVPEIIVCIAALVWTLLSYFGSILWVEKIVVAVGAVFVALSGLVLSGMLNEKLGEAVPLRTRRRWKQARKGKKKADRIRASASFRKGREEYDRQAEESMALAEAWHKAWFDACRKPLL